MAPTKGRKRAYSNSNLSVEDSDLDGFGQDDADSFRPAQAKKRRGTEWSSVQAGARNQEADRVKQYVTAFEKGIVAAGRDKAMATLSRGEEATAKENKRTLERIRDAYETASIGASLGAADHPLYIAGREVLALFHDTLARYEEAGKALQQALLGAGDGDGNDNGDAGTTTKSVDAVQVSWQQDRAEAHKLLRYGRVYGDSLVHEIIVPKTSADGGTAGGGKAKDLVSGMAAPAGGLNQTGRSALQMFPRSRATVARGQTWGEAAKSQVQALKGLLKTLPGVGGQAHGGTSVRKSVTFDC
ncbi:hypothetical protein SPBR_03963 [Sporothrix brasiliensis 5110]|uniref:Uncharacterized protein n=1 Tax=Sporothrix brasiliensis 5110 TaxID=1398154 RepID=A0A0C2FW33_9PEZI|nr:uncharacterized protein SPBR_03963 [Sporothrix brasiliensis 5110]KIH95223.1 hypothetical protein SPBR_03963 [Sporothrix brasiliensis 5110]